MAPGRSGDARHQGTVHRPERVGSITIKEGYQRLMKTRIQNVQILRDLASNPYISQRELAERHRISLGKVNYAIRALIKKGYVKIHNFCESNNKHKYAYMITPEGIYEKTKLMASFLNWKMEEYERIKQEIAELEEEMHRGADL